MELVKNNLLTFQLISNPIQNNFQLIQKEFSLIHQILKQLKTENQKINDNLAQCMTNTSQMYQLQLTQKSQIAAIINKQNNLPIIQIKKTTSQIGNFQTQIPSCNGPINSIIKQKIDQEKISQKITSHSILKDISNRQEPKLHQKNLQERHQEMIRSKTKKLSIFNNSQICQQNSKKKDDISFIQNKLRIFQANLLEEISELNKQLLQFQQTQNVFKSKFELLQKQSQTFKKLLGIKKKTNVPQKKDTEKNQQNTTKSKKKFESKGKISLKAINENENQSQKNQKKKLNISENNSEFYEDQQQNGILILNKEIQKIRDYLNGKMKAIDQNFNLVNSNIQNIQRNIQILQRTDNDLKEDLQTLQQTCNQTKLNLCQISQKTMIKSRFRSNDLFKDQGFKNSDNDKQSQGVQDKIIKLLDEMEKLKSEYYSMFFKNQNSQGENEKVSQQILEKRKKLALKLNSNSSLDQKTKKQVTSVKRDLKKLREQFDLLMNGVNSGSHQTKTLIIKPNQTKQEWKSLTTKIYKTRQQLLSIIKELQTKIVANNDLTVILNQMEVGIGQCKILLKKKVDLVEFQKTSKRIQNRLNNFIKQTFEKEGYTNQQDAVIAKKPWFCLSCDIQLKTYTGKINNTQGNQSPSQKPMGKKVNPESHMVRRNQNGRLPSLAL